MKITTRDCTDFATQMIPELRGTDDSKIWAREATFRDSGALIRQFWVSICKWPSPKAVEYDFYVVERDGKIEYAKLGKYPRPARLDARR